MKIGLVRHFKVDIKPKKYMNSEEYNEYAKLYNLSPVIPNEFFAGNHSFKVCYCSDLSRAITTANTIYKGKIIVTEKLREIPVAARFKVKKKFRLRWWDITSRIAWSFNHPSQPEGKKDTIKRINEFLDEIEKLHEDNVLIVCHAALMYSMRKELIKRGYKGDKFLRAKNGTLYVFDKK